nr:myosin regulatory light chain 10 [Pogona vitticeps]
MAPKMARHKKEGGGSNVFSMFDQSQIQEFKEAFTIMDQNRDGFIDKADLRDTFAALGTDPEEIILNAFRIFDREGKGYVKADYMKEMLMTQADRFTEEEVKQTFSAFPPDPSGNLDYKNLVYVITHGEEKD